MPRSAVKLIPVTQQDETADDRARVAETLRLVGLDDHERAFLATCQKMYREGTGTTTPFEEFFQGLALDVELGRMPTPDDVEHALEEFRMNWNDMKRDASRFLAAYPEKKTTAV